MHILVDIFRQRLSLLADDGFLVHEYAVSTAALGVGEQKGSFQTPRGLHVVRAKIGGELPAGAVQKGRRSTEEICTPALMTQNPDRDWILSRILWLSGCQPGFNRLGCRDTMARYIYIHGTPDSEPIGVPRSHGCIRMRNADVIALFEQVPVGTEVLIQSGDMDVPAVFPLVVLDWLQAGRVVRPLREAVFVHEHGISLEQEFDEKDKTARHLVIWSDKGEVVACARLLREGYLGRLAVLPAWRGQGLGKRLLIAAIEEAQRFGWKELRVLSMASKTALYTPFGFEPVGEVFESAGLAHQSMRRFL